ncbi:MAG: hypothetical protein M0008_14555 [Actinomycetota bacterium]|jgi:hypothetical protein|nr:hypothetical protein [Actinomycetota bacterium]
MSVLRWTSAGEVQKPESILLVEARNPHQQVGVVHSELGAHAGTGSAAT